MSLTTKIESMIAAVNNLMGVIDGKLRGKAEATEVYSRTYLNDSANTLGANAATANKLKVARSIDLSGDASGSVSFDGSGNVTLSVTVPTLDDKANKTDTLTPAQIDARIEQVIGSAPEVLDTLKEIADALGNDPNFAASMTAELAKKADKTTVFTKTESNTNFLAKGAKAADTTLFGGNSPSHYATGASLSALEQEVGDAFTRLASSFNDGAAQINAIGS